MPFNPANTNFQLKLKDFNATKTTCIHGHPLTGDNVMWQSIKGRRKYPICKICRRATQKAHRDRNGSYNNATSS